MEEKKGGWFRDLMRGAWESTRFKQFIRAGQAARARRQAEKEGDANSSQLGDFDLSRLGAGEGGSFADQLVFEMGQGGGIIPEEAPGAPQGAAPQAQELPEEVYRRIYQELLGRGASPKWAEQRAYDLMARLYRGG